MTTIGSAVGKVAMATGAIKSLIDTLKEGEFSMESFTSVLMSLGMLLPAIGGGIGFVIAAMKAKKIITQEDTKATG
jgi:hypothetical protein